MSEEFSVKWTPSIQTCNKCVGGDGKSPVMVCMKHTSKDRLTTRLVFSCVTCGNQFTVQTKGVKRT